MVRDHSDTDAVGFSFPNVEFRKYGTRLTRNCRCDTDAIGFSFSNVELTKYVTRSKQYCRCVRKNNTRFCVDVFGKYREEHKANNRSTLDDGSDTTADGL